MLQVKGLTIGVENSPRSLFLWESASPLKWARSHGPGSLESELGSTMASLAMMGILPPGIEFEVRFGSWWMGDLWLMLGEWGRCTAEEIGERPSRIEGRH